MSQGGGIWQNTKSRLVNAIAQVRELETGEFHCQRCGEVVHLKETAQRRVDTSISDTLEIRLATKVNKTRTRETSTLGP